MGVVDIDYVLSSRRREVKRLGVIGLEYVGQPFFLCTVAENQCDNQVDKALLCALFTDQGNPF